MHCFRVSRQYKVLTLEDTVAMPTEGLTSTRRQSSTRQSVRGNSLEDISDFRLDRLSGLLDDPDIQSVFKRTYSLEDVAGLDEDDTSYTRGDGRSYSPQDGTSYSVLTDEYPYSPSEEYYANGTIDQASDALVSKYQLALCSKLPLQYLVLSFCFLKISVPFTFLSECTLDKVEFKMVLG